MSAITIEINGKDFNFKRTLEGSVNSARKKGKEAGGVFSKGFGESLKNSAVTGAAIGVAAEATRRLADSFRQGFRDVQNFSEAVAEVNTLLPQNQRLTKDVTDQFVNFSKQFGTDQSAQVKAFYSIVSAGVKTTEKRLATLQSANAAATAGLVDINTAATVLVSSVNTYASAGLTAQKASDVLFTAVRLGQTTFGELASTLGKVAPLAQSVGISFSELVGTIAQLTKAGISTSAAANGIRAAISNLLKPAEQAKKAAKKLGIEFNATALEAKGFAGVLEDVKRGTGGNAEQISQLFGSVEAQGIVLSLVNGDFKDFNSTLNQTANSAGVTSQAFAEIQRNNEALQIRQTTADFAALRTEFIQGLLPAFKTFLKNIKTILDNIRFLREQLSGLSQSSDLSKQFTQATKAIQETDSEIEKLTDRLNRLKSGEDVLDTKTVITRFGERQVQVAADEEEIQKRLVSLFEKRASLQKQVNQLRPDVIQGPPLPDESEQEDQMGLADNEDEDKDKKVKEEAQGVSDAFSGIGQGIKNAVTQGEEGLGSLSESFAEVGTAAVKSLAVGVSGAFAKFGAALRQGQDGFQAFGQALVGTLGSISQSIGQAFILQGAGYFYLNPALGTGLIAAGVALSTFGGFLSGGSGGASTPSSTIGTTATTTDFSENRFNEPQEEERQANQNVQLVVQGDILDSEDTGKRLVKILNDNFENEGSALINGRFA